MASEPDVPLLSKFIKQTRTASHLGLRELGQDIGLSASRLGQIERGGWTQNMGVGTLVRLATWLRVRPDVLLAGMMQEKNYGHTAGSARRTEGYCAYQASRRGRARKGGRKK